ncbi:hypothetical protein L5515_007129 [Caenorhabditis briggsae]|uniref:Uncharacterized protein n=1 Tax=Caenorhabditis briggsae TaxID=6238 RepID=A0AAE9F4A4_CAEBR|nr:hypothetical protein L5515_007129 [Caenorhabditis briggsae]
MGEQTESGTSKEKPIEIDEDEESSDGENSVIILDSDTEPEDRADDENRVEEEDDDDEEESEDSESDDEDSDSSIDTDSVNSVWSDVKESAGAITAEAAEAKTIKKFEKAITFIADEEIDKGQKILEKLLDDPIVSCYRQEELDYESLEEPPRLAKMLKIYIATHKNLAKLAEKALEREGLDEKEKFELKHEEIQHLCQVLAYEPNNSEIWFDVAMKCVEFGDLNFAKYSFKRCESLKESLEAHATLLFVTCDYSGCLTVLKQYQEQNDLNDKMKYLKFKIRSTNQYYKLLCDRIFEEDEVYANVDIVEKIKIMAFDERINELRKRIEENTRGIMEQQERIEGDEEWMSAIQVNISDQLDLPSVCTLFCDLFDRINAHSHCRNQLIEISEWESRRDYLDVILTLEKIVDIVDCVEEMTEKTEEMLKTKKGRRQKRQEKKEYLANWRRRLFVERGSVDDVADSEANTTADEDDSQVEDDDGMPDLELAQEFHLEYSEVKSLRCGERRRERTPPPSQPSEFIDCDAILELLGFRFNGGPHTILDIIEETLLIITEHVSHNALPESMRQVTREMYNRLALFEDVQEEKYHEMGLMLIELGSRKAMETMVLCYISSIFKQMDPPKHERIHVLRFMWKYSHTGLKDETKLEYLHTLRSLLEPEESVATSCGSFATWDVDLAIDDLEKKKRIDSVKHLWKAKNYESLVEILENDIDFSTIGTEEAMELLSYWMQSLERMKAYVEFVDLLARVMHFYLFSVEEEKMVEKHIESILFKLHRISGAEYSKIPNQQTLSTTGYFICHVFKKFPRFEKDWRNWRVLYEIVRIQRGDAKEYIETLNRTDHPNVMPLLEMDLLVKAHEVLGEHQCCAQKSYDFLLFVIDKYRELVEENIPILEICYLKENGFLWNNLNEELSQILFCLFGKFSRKVRARENHENGGKCVNTLEIATRVLSVILVQPLPLHDDKEKLMHDVIELINSKFPFFLEVSNEKKEQMREFKAALKKSCTIEDVDSSLDKYRDDVHTYLQSMVWYAMALSSFRQNSFKEASKFAELYLLTEESACDNRLRMSAWAILAHTNMHDLFQLDLCDIYDQWKWRIMPSRLAIQAQEHEPIPHFELAARLYQLATCLARFHRTLAKDDPRRADTQEIAKLREESRRHLDKSLELTRLNDNGTQPEHQWLCYFFIGKIEAKMATWDILKVVESFYEAACGCELTGFYYPQKVQTKRQQNFEPLEVHYQAFSAVYKYLENNELPDLKMLRKLKVMLAVLSDGHKVAKPSSSLFKVNPEVYEVADELVMATVTEEDGNGDGGFKDEDLRKELVSDIKDLCMRAFSVVSEKFPHIKSFYRLAQIYLGKGEFGLASEQIFKNVFKRKKRDDGMFDHIVEITCADLNRNGSHSFHIERCIKIGAQIAQKTNDLHHVVGMLQTMVGIISKNDEQHIDKPSWRPVVTLYLTAMEQIVSTRDHTSTRSTPSPGPDRPKTHHLSMKSLRTDLWRLWQTLQKCSKPQEELIRLIRAKTEVIIVHCFNSIEELRRRNQSSTTGATGVDGKKKVVIKRKFDAVDVAKSLQGSSSSSSTLDTFVQKASSSAGSSTSNQQLTDMARAFLLNAQNSSPNKQSYNELALQLTKLMTSQKSTSSPSKPDSTPATSSANTASTSSNIVRPVPRYSPISEDDEVQCIEPPAKKAAVTASAAPIAQLPAPTKPVVGPPKPPTTVVKPIIKPIIKPVAKPASTPSALNMLTSSGTSSKPGPSNSNSAQNLQAAKKPTVAKPAIPATLTNSNQREALLKFALANISSTDAQTKLLVHQTLKALNVPNAAAVIAAASKSVATGTSSASKATPTTSLKPSASSSSIRATPSTSAPPKPTHSASSSSIKATSSASGFLAASSKATASSTSTPKATPSTSATGLLAASSKPTTSSTSSTVISADRTMILQALQQAQAASQIQQIQLALQQAQQAQKAQLARENAEKARKAQETHQKALLVQLAKEQAEKQAKENAEKVRKAQEARTAQEAHQKSLLAQKAKEQAEKLAREKAAKEALEAKKREEQQRDYFQKIAYQAHAKQEKEKQKNEQQEALIKAQQQAVANQLNQLNPAALMAFMNAMGGQMNLPGTSGVQPQKPAQRIAQQISQKAPVTSAASSSSQAFRAQPAHQIVRPQPQRPKQAPPTTSSGGQLTVEGIEQALSAFTDPVYKEKMRQSLMGEFE